jgi:hypothetical protein
MFKLPVFASSISDIELMLLLHPLYIITFNPSDFAIFVSVLS